MTGDRFEERLHSLNEVAKRANEEQERGLKQLAKEFILKKIEGGGDNPLLTTGRPLFEKAKEARELFPDSKIARVLSGIATGYERRMKGRLRDQFNRVEGVIDEMAPRELFQLFRAYTEGPLEEILDSLERK